jgi:hypothetical protein
MICTTTLLWLKSRTAINKLCSFPLICVMLDRLSCFIYIHIFLF